MITYGPLNHTEMLGNLFSVINQNNLGEHQKYKHIPPFENKCPVFQEQNTIEMLQWKKELGQPEGGRGDMLPFLVILNILIVILLR